MRNFIVLLLLVIMILIFGPAKFDDQVVETKQNRPLNNRTQVKKKNSINLVYPDKNAIRNNSHYFSQEYLKFARQMGKLKKEIITRPENLNRGLDFLIECTHNNELTIAVRSLCLSNIYYFEKRFNINVSEVPINERLTELARLVSDI